MANNGSIIKPIITGADGVPLMALEDQIRVEPIDFFLDNSWAKNAFLIDDESLDDPDDIANRYWSSADAKFTDTRIGCNIGVNPKSQFTRYSDIRAQGRVPGRNKVSLTSVNGNYGMGRYYSEAIDDPAQTIYMTFGVEQFNSLTSFLGTAYNSNLLSLARTGRATSAFYTVGKLAGTITAVVAFPAVAALIAGTKLLEWVFARPTSKFYTMKRTMHLYWSSVQSMVNNLAINMGIFPKIMAADSTKGQRLDQPFTLDQDYLNQLSQLMPDVFPNSGGDAKNYFDVYALVNKAQRTANLAFLEDYDKLNQGTATYYTGYLKKEMSGNGSHTTYISTPSGSSSFAAYLNKVLSFSYYLSSDDNPRVEQDPRVSPDDKDPTKKKDPSFFKSFVEHFDAEFRDGSQFAVFKVNHTGPVSESFSSSVMESQISNKLNSISSEMRQASFAFANGNLIGGAVGTAIGVVTSSVKELAMGALDGVTFGFSNLLPGLGGGGYIDIPKHWQSSTANLPRIQYQIHLNSPYGNVMSRMLKIVIPLCMLLVPALPRSTGAQSYTSPFLCQIFDRGRQQIKLGMIESISITRGVSHLAFDLKGNALAMDVSFTVVDLSSIMHMPVSSGSLFSADMGLDEDNILTDYLAVLAGQDLYTQLYALPKAKLRLAKTVASLNKLTSPAYWASMVHDSATAGTLKYLTLGAGNVLEGLVRLPEATMGSVP